MPRNLAVFFWNYETKLWENTGTPPLEYAKLTARAFPTDFDREYEYDEADWKFER